MGQWAVSSNGLTLKAALAVPKTAHKLLTVLTVSEADFSGLNVGRYRQTVETVSDPTSLVRSPKATVENEVAFNPYLLKRN